MKKLLFILSLLSITTVALAPPNVDPFQRCAKDALAGRYGKLAKWKREAYQKGINNGVTISGRTKSTTYCPRCDPSSKAGPPKYIYNVTCAASTNIKRYAIVWTESHGLRRVTDRGGWVDLDHVQAGESANLDLFVKRCPGTNCWNGNTGTKHQVRYAVIR